MSKWPVQIQGDDTNANDSMCSCMVHVFDKQSETNVFTALSKMYLHVIAYNTDGKVILTYDNR